MAIFLTCTQHSSFQRQKMLYCQQNMKTILRPDVSDLCVRVKHSLLGLDVLFINRYIVVKTDFVLPVKLSLAISPEIKMGYWELLAWRQSIKLIPQCTCTWCFVAAQGYMPQISTSEKHVNVRTKLRTSQNGRIHCLRASWFPKILFCWLWVSVWCHTWYIF